MNHDDQDRGQEAAERTDLAEDRTILANERTFAGWMRTGFAAIGIALGFTALFRALEPSWIPKSIATVFLLIGMFLVVAAERRACAVMDRLSPNEIQSFRRINLRLVTWAVCLATVALIGAIWFLAG